MAVDSKEAYESCKHRFDEMMDKDLVKKNDEPDWTIQDRRIANLQRQISSLLNYIRLKRYEDGEE